MKFYMTKNELYFILVGFILGFFVGQAIPMYKAEARPIHAYGKHLHGDVVDKVGVVNAKCIELGDKALKQIEGK